MALLLGGFISWYAVPTAYDQTSSAQKMAAATQMMEAAHAAGKEDQKGGAQAKGLRGQELYDEAIAIVDKFLGTGFEGGRHERRIAKIDLPTPEQQK